MNSAERYFHYAATIRWCLEYNHEDYEFSRAGGRITYLVDANIVRFFMHPAAEATQHFGVFGQGAKIETNAMITAEFMLSRELAGQRRAPAFIAPGHAEDVADIIEAVGRTGPDLREPPNRNRLEALLHDIEANRIRPEDAIRQLTELVPKVAEVFATYLEVEHLKRVYDEDLVRPLASHRNATRDILEVDNGASLAVIEWTRRIRKWEATAETERRSGRPAPQATARETGSSRRELRVVERDARVLVQLEMLAAAADPECRYVLITADTVLFDTYARWYWQEVREKSPRPPFLLRLPLQYCPILNLNEMPNGLDESVNRQTSSSLDPLFEDLRRVDPDYPNSLSFLRTLVGHKQLTDTLLGFFGFDPLSLDDATQKQFKDMRLDWLATFGQSSVINAPLLNRRVCGNLDRLVRLLQDRRDFLEALRDELQRTILDLEQSHLAFSTGVNIRLLHRSFGPKSSEDALRSPGLIRASFPRILGELELNDALNRLSHRDGKLLNRVSREMHKLLDFEAYFFAACVAHRCGLWHGAYLYANRARDFIGAEPPAGGLHELDFLRANSARNALRSKGSLDVAADVLARLVKDAQAQSDHFGLARALCEQAAFYLVILFADALDVIRNPELKRQAPKVMAGIYADSAEAIARAQQTGSESDFRLTTFLSNHAASNVVAADLYARLYADGDERRAIAPDDATVAAARLQIDALRERHPWTFIVELEKAMLSFVRNERSPDEVLYEITALKSRADKARVQMTRLDEREIQDFESRLKNAIQAKMVPPQRATAE
nr:hypothetical protein [uncultured Rhodopila sp.]